MKCPSEKDVKTWN